MAQPVPLEGFVRYGQWYQRKAIPDLDHRAIIRIESDPKGFRATLADGETIVSKRVVVAAGIGSFMRRPKEFDALRLPWHRILPNTKTLASLRGRKWL